VFRVISSAAAATRLEAARRFLDDYSPSTEALVVAASRGAADDFVRRVTRDRGATCGLARSSLIELAARMAASAPEPRTPGTQAGAEAIAARAVFDAIGAGELTYFGPVASMPGFPRALARTLHELRLAGIASEHIADGVQQGAGGERPRLTEADAEATADVGRLLARVEEHLERGSIDDRPALFRLATAACRRGPGRWTQLPLVLLDVPLDSQVERDFVAQVIECAPAAMATIPAGDTFARDAFASMGAAIEDLDEIPGLDSDLATLRRYVFTLDRPPARAPAGDVTLFSAPGEGREMVEIVRRVLDEAARGVPFDEMAVVLRAPQPYLGLLEHACARGGVPVYFDRGTQRPDPAGRAFVALLSCAVEGLSAKRFDEYLSLGQVPRIGRQSTVDCFVPPLDEVLAVRLATDSTGEAGDRAEGDGDSAPDEAPDTDEEAVVAGTLRSPWKWEELIVESAVVGGRTLADGRARWRRRLDGLAADFRYRMAELRNEEPESPRVARLERDLRNLGHLRLFALPIIDNLSEWPERATWGEWLERLTRLAAQALKRPTRVLQTLADLRPMATVGPVTLEEVRDVLHDRLVALEWDPPRRRYGCLFVCTPHQARGRSFRVVFIPGLAERVVPQRPREDPLLVDERRRILDPDLIRQDARGHTERLLLRIAIGAARERVYLSYPRLDVAESRARVPSFYALDVVRAITGRIPDHRVLAAEAAEAGGASLAWPAPRDPDRAIDDLEHDLAILKPLLDARDSSVVKGHAHYLLGLNEALRRSVIARWGRGKPSWSISDGLIRVAPETRAAIASQRLHRRPYSLSALQRFATCPYQFLLSTIYRLEPWDEPEPILHLDPLTRGSLYHRVQAEFFRAMKAARALPVRSEKLPLAVETLTAVLDRVAAEYAETLAPAIDRIWRDDIDELRRDLGIWVQRLADGGPWEPLYFEFSFGLSDEGRDPASLKDPIVIDQGYVLRGSVDLIEHDPGLDVLRVTDHKTGRNRSNPDLIVDGGKVLQPVLYSMAVERGLHRKVAIGRLFFSTTAGGFAELPIRIDEHARGQALQVLGTIDRAIEHGFLPAAPAERACAWCDFRVVCGPHEEERVRRKHRDRLADLEALRSMR
jgi:CRISPR/Cas system-associated exonuclease Cas4 (RecB family)